MRARRTAVGDAFRTAEGVPQHGIAMLARALLLDSTRVAKWVRSPRNYMLCRCFSHLRTATELLAASGVTCQVGVERLALVVPSWGPMGASMCLEARAFTRPVAQRPLVTVASGVMEQLSINVTAAFVSIPLV